MQHAEAADQFEHTVPHSSATQGQFDWNTQQEWLFTSESAQWVFLVQCCLGQQQPVAPEEILTSQR